MVKRTFPVVLLLLCCMAVMSTNSYAQEAMEPESYFGSASYKMVRGVTNAVTSPFEIPKQIVVTTKEIGFLGPVLGIFKGVGMTCMRVVTGAWEVGTFFAPNDMDGNFGPILKPEYVWNPSVSTDPRTK